jgi:hypothetical protein
VIKPPRSIVWDAGEGFGTPILTAGLKVQPWSTPARDAQLAELSKLSAERICWAFGIPLQLLGLANTPATSTETLMGFWLSTGLGFALNHIEQSFDRLFNLRGEPEEYCEFDTAALLRSAWKDRIEALVRGVQGGVFAPNEARNMEGFDGVPYGDEPRTQAQVVPLSAAGSIPTAPGPAVSPSAPVAKSGCRATRRRCIADAHQAHRGVEWSRGAAGACDPQSPRQRPAATGRAIDVFSVEWMEGILPAAAAATGELRGTSRHRSGLHPGIVTDA